MKSSILGIVFLVTLCAKSTVQLTEEQMDLTLKPCVVHNVNCPRDGSMGNYGVMKKELEMMKVGIQMQGGRMPHECTICGSGERCDRECYYALLKVAMLEVRADQTIHERPPRRDD